MKRILIIDDDLDTLELLKYFLQKNGFEVTTYSSGRIEVTEVLGFAPHLIIIDVYLRGGNGVEICNRLKADDTARNIPVIMSSAQTTDYLILRKCAAEDFIAKPIDTDKLMTKIDHLIKVSEQGKTTAPSIGL